MDCNITHLLKSLKSFEKKIIIAPQYFNRTYRDYWSCSLHLNIRPIDRFVPLSSLVVREIQEWKTERILEMTGIVQKNKINKVIGCYSSDLVIPDTDIARPSNRIFEAIPAMPRSIKLMGTECNKMWNIYISFYAKWDSSGVIPAFRNNGIYIYTRDGWGDCSMSPTLKWMVVRILGCGEHLYYLSVGVLVERRWHEACFCVVNQL